MSSDAAQREILRIANRLKVIFANRIDLSDVEQRPKDDQANFYNTRSLAALYLKSEVPLSSSEAARSVTDGGNDEGIDAIHWNERAKILYLLQSKWRSKPHKGIELAEFLKFRDGVDGILRGDVSSANDKIKAMQPSIAKALGDIETKVRMVLVHTSEQLLSNDIARRSKEFQAKHSAFDPDFLHFEECGLASVVNMARAEARPSNIDLEVMIRNFGRITEPYEAVYGVVAGADIAAWAEKYGDRLFSENLRFFLEETEVNSSIIQTVEQQADAFWYYNNGVTVICDEIRKKPIGGPDNQSGVFDVTAMSIVNGAQTVGSIRAAKDRPLSLDSVRVHVRFISLRGSPEGFGANITRTNNTQNNLNPMDFVALDQHQERLSHELKQMGVQYAFRRGELIGDPARGFDLRDATIALACANPELRLAVYAKRYISGLWDDIGKEPYTALFNANLTGRYLWNLIRVSRAIDERVLQLADARGGRDRLILVHANRFLLHLVLNDTDLDALKKEGVHVKTRASTAVALAEAKVERLVEVFNAQLPEAYPGNVFKNQERQELLKASIAA